jgi:L-seryl-tRNA(Ser) seleniumtransferase
MLRALRIDKLSLAALEATLRLYQNEDTLRESLPLLKLLTQDEAQLAAKAQSLQKSFANIEGLTVEIADGHGYAGGGSLPDEKIATKLVTVRPANASVDALAAALRALDTPIVGRIADGAFVLDMRTLFDDDLKTIVAAFKQVSA